MFNAALNDFCTPEALAFYEENKHVEDSKLLLKYANNPQKKAWALQLESRKRAEFKLPTWFKNPKIVFPLKLNLEQASSEITAQYKATLVNFTSSADLTGGTGIDSWQFALHGQNHIFIEPNNDLIELAKHNFVALGITNTHLFCGIAEDFLAQNKTHFDVIFVDPSRRTSSGSKAVVLEQYSPNVVEMQETLLRTAKNVLIKVSPFADISYLIGCFKNRVSHVHVVAVGNECKEILLLLAAENNLSPKIVTRNFTTAGAEEFDFELADEDKKAELATEMQRFLFEPNAAVLKAGAFTSVAHAFNLKKLHVNSHLYTADAAFANFPGRIYNVNEVAAPYKLKAVYPNLSIATRNFPDKPEAIRKRLKVREGNDFRLFATTLGAKKVFIVGTIFTAKP